MAKAMPFHTAEAVWNDKGSGSCDRSVKTLRHPKSILRKMDGGRWLTKDGGLMRIGRR
jgi:hypothetical protein